MLFSPRGSQAEIQQRMVEEKALLVALRMGAGKTVVTLLAIDELLRDRFEITKALVVAPKRVAELVWHAEAAKWDQTQALRVQRVLGAEQERVAALQQPADVYVINRENFAWLQRHCGAAWPFDCVVIDENRGFKDRASRSWQALKKVRPSIRRLYILTGTPTPNSLLELWPQISILDCGQRLGRSLTAFRDRWFVPDRRNREVVYSWMPRPGAEQEIHAAVADVMISVEHGVVLPSRTDNIVRVAFDMTRYNELKKDMVSGGVVAQSAAVLAGKLAQMANGAVYDEDRVVHQIHDAKLDALEEVLEQGEPVLCFTAYRHDQQRIKQRFPMARVFDGAPSLADWQQGSVKLLLMHPASGGHGIDGLQLGGSVAVWFGLPFSLELYEQANARLHRHGQAHNVTIHHLVAVNTIDEEIMEALATKGDVQTALIRAVTRVIGRNFPELPARPLIEVSAPLEVVQ